MAWSGLRNQPQYHINRHNKNLVLYTWYFFKKWDVERIWKRCFWNEKKHGCIAGYLCYSVISKLYFQKFPKILYIYNHLKTTMYTNGIKWMLTKSYHIPFMEETNIKPSWLKYAEHNVPLCNFYISYPSQVI